VAFGMLKSGASAPKMHARHGSYSTSVIKLTVLKKSLLGYLRGSSKNIQFSGDFSIVILVRLSFFMRYF
jgi:hypothetical protein